MTCFSLFDIESLMNNDTTKISQDIVHAYRGRAKQTAQDGQIFDRTIFMDDLSGVQSADPNTSGQGNFHEVLKESLGLNIFTDIEARKVAQSLIFEDSRNAPPTKQRVAQLGGEFRELQDIEETINGLTKDINYLQEHIGSEFPKSSMKSVDYASELSQKGLSYIREKCSGLHPVDFIIGEMPPHNAFNAQVVTDDSGQIVCEIPSLSPVSPSFAYLIVHEIMGHVLHFTQLRHNPGLKDRSPHLLCLSIHTHEKFFIEAIAQLITKYMLSKSSWTFPGKEMALLSSLKHERNLAAMHYLFGEIIDGTMSCLEAAEKYISYGRIDQPANAFAKRFEVTVSSLFETSVMMNYYPSLCVIKPIFDLPEAPFFEILPQLLTTYFVPETLAIFVNDKVSK